MSLLKLVPAKLRTPAPPGGITLVVHAPYGTDPELSGYPGTAARPIEKHPLLRHLQAVADCGVHVCALVDLVDDQTWLVEWKALDRKPTITSRWKQQMHTVATLAELILHARKTRPDSALVLGLEGHGAGYMPELDRRVLDVMQVTDRGKFDWRLGAERTRPEHPDGRPVVAMGSPLLAMGSPLLPANHLPMSTWALGQALKLGTAKGQKIGVVHFNNCFNLSTEVLHTIAGHADWAVGYPNYNFFSAGAAYALAFQAFKKAGSTADVQQLALWMAEANHQVLKQKPHHPTVGGAVKLATMVAVARGVDALAKALIDALKIGPGGPNTALQHRAVAQQISQAIRRSQQYDTHTPISLESPDELTDLASLATELLNFPFNTVAVTAAATQLRKALAGIKVYGDKDSPWMAPQVPWNFGRPDLAMNILCPDPALKGLWDWRSPFYLQPNADLARPAVQPHVIAFLKQTAWVPFIIEFHRHEPFSGLRVAPIPAFNRFNPDHNVP